MPSIKPSDQAYIFQEQCGCVTAVMMAHVPDLGRQLGVWGRYKPKGTISLVHFEEAKRRINMKYPKEHQHEPPVSPENQRPAPSAQDDAGRSSR